ncbi:MAG: hypothetical protein R3B13_28615 [Polyangiaceae bacterium]
MKTIGALIGVAMATLALGCGSPPAKAPNPTRTLDERRAVEIIIRAFRAEQDQPIPGSPIELEEGKPLEVDVGSNGRKYGVAYVTANERRALGSALPPKAPGAGDALQLVRGIGDGAEAKILVLHDTDYVYDDHMGAEHQASTITAERKLERDVRDFLVRAHAERWP